MTLDFRPPQTTDLVPARRAVGIPGQAFSRRLITRICSACQLVDQPAGSAAVCGSRSGSITGMPQPGMRQRRLGRGSPGVMVGEQLAGLVGVGQLDPGVRQAAVGAGAGALAGGAHARANRPSTLREGPRWSQRRNNAAPPGIRCSNWRSIEVAASGDRRYGATTYLSSHLIQSKRACGETIMTPDRWPPARPWPTRHWPARPWPAETEAMPPAPSATARQ
jgi:hypothetical protein